jgi:hypothetical protein
MEIMLDVVIFLQETIFVIMNLVMIHGC